MIFKLKTLAVVIFMASTCYAQNGDNGDDGLGIASYSLVGTSVFALIAQTVGETWNETHSSNTIYREQMMRDLRDEAGAFLANPEVGPGLILHEVFVQYRSFSDGPRLSDHELALAVFETTSLR